MGEAPKFHAVKEMTPWTHPASDKIRGGDPIPFLVFFAPKMTLSVTVILIMVARDLPLDLGGGVTTHPRGRKAAYTK